MILTIRPFEQVDASEVRELFIQVNRQIAPSHLQDAFESHTARSLDEEIDRIGAYCSERHGAFWVAVRDGHVVGTAGIELAGDAMELRRMYVRPCYRRQGIAKRLLQWVEANCSQRGIAKLILSTSELQPEALALYKAAGYRMTEEKIALAASNKTVGAGACVTARI